jgi:hypothetical protein
MSVKNFGSSVAVVVALLTCAGLAFPAPVSAKEKPKPKAVPKAKAKPKEPEPPPSASPWSLRDHFRFPQDKVLLRYAVETAEWSVEINEAQPVIDNAKFQIAFSDGAILDASGLGKAESEREKFDNQIGKGTAYVSVFPPKDGLAIRHSIAMFAERPFFFIRVGIGNNSEKPIEIAKITVAAFGPGGIAHLSPDTQLSAHRLLWRGGCPVFTKDPASTLTILQDRAQGLTFSFGVLPEGIAASSFEITASGGSWLGDATCVYDPPVRIDPGQKIESDPIWCTLMVPEPDAICENYAWSASVLPHPLCKNLLRAWVTAEDGAGQDDVLSAAKVWSGILKGVLVPAGWEGRPGSLEGSTPRYPKEMSKLAKQLETAGFTPGICVDPLMTSEGAADRAAKAPDGTMWLQLTDPEARKQSVERMRKLVGWGYKFFVVPPSSIPNEVLKHFNMTRAQAYTLAVTVMAEAAGDLPVLPSSACTLKADVNDWRQAAAAENGMAKFGMTTGPVRFEVGALQSLDDTIAEAITGMAGPIEFMGTPKGKLGEQLVQILSHGR